MIPMGTFTQNTADQENSSTRMPPTTGPAPNPNPAAAAQIPMAAVRRSGGYASARIDRLSGATRAAPTPCAARAAMSADSSVERAQAADIAVKIASPTRNTRLRPYRSPKVPPTMMSDARAEDVRVDDPDQVARIHVELALDRGQGNVHNRVVEQNHALGDAHRDERHDPTSGTERLPSHR